MNNFGFATERDHPIVILQVLIMRSKFDFHVEKMCDRKCLSFRWLRHMPQKESDYGMRPMRFQYNIGPAVETSSHAAIRDLERLGRAVRDRIIHDKPLLTGTINCSN